MKTFTLLAILIFIALAGCERKGPAEKAGESIDRAAENVGDALKGRK